ncbi:MAG: NAD(P)H-dependent oxidoreductase subunit E [Nevskia sp.]|nr:NAD(P)H-dependent oxidoreductase subunit E [Nevskia sp.]
MINSAAPASYYRHHVFFCCNQRTDGRASCEDHGASELRDYCKNQVKKAALTGVGRARINQAGCLDRCERGPVMVVYPEGVWYRYQNKADIDEIVSEHLAQGRVVDRLRI